MCELCCGLYIQAGESTGDVHEWLCSLDARKSKLSNSISHGVIEVLSPGSGLMENELEANILQYSNWKHLGSKCVVMLIKCA
jgi:hypothetical protein